uniref:Transmembrane protein n=1 Tax=Octactis speculum TaxID=3111310 RepID=A0A7S2F774_9STRA
MHGWVVSSASISFPRSMPQHSCPLAGALASLDLSDASDFFPRRLERVPRVLPRPPVLRLFRLALFLAHSGLFQAFFHFRVFLRPRPRFRDRQHLREEVLKDRSDELRVLLPHPALFRMPFRPSKDSATTS